VINVPGVPLNLKEVTIMLPLLREAAKTANKGWGPTIRLAILIATVAASAMLMGQAVQLIG
jgi:hypothetical protein